MRLAALATKWFHFLGFAAVSLAFGLVRSREVRARKSGDEYLLPFRVLQAVLTYRHE